MNYSHRTHVQCLRTPIKRTHIKAFLLYTGAVLMVVDATTSIIHVTYMFEHVATSSGKFGAAMAGVSCFFEKLLEA